MKHKISVITLTICLILSMTVGAFADDTLVNENEGTTLTQTQETQVTIEPIQEDTQVTMLKVSANDTTGLHKILLGLIGDYNPIVTDHIYNQSGSYYSHHVEVTPDWSWIASALLFIVVIFCLFRLLGGIFAK